MTTPEGTFCIVTGVELRGVELKCFDFRQCCTPCWAPKSKRHASQRRVRSIKKCERRAMGLGRMEVSTLELFATTSRLRAKVRETLNAASVVAAKKQLAGSPPPLRLVMKSIRAVKQRPAITAGASPAQLRGVSRALWRLSTAVSLHRDTYASLGAFALLFASTITSKTVVEIQQLCKRVGAPDLSHAILDPITPHAIPETAYSKFGVSCRAMSKMWREIKTAAASRAQSAPGTLPPSRASS